MSASRNDKPAKGAHRARTRRISPHRNEALLNHPTMTYSLLNTGMIRSV
jgi:hypothetical protein